MPRTTITPSISLPASLVSLYREHAVRLPPLSQAAATGLRLALLQAGIDPADLPPSTIPASRTTAATLAASQRRAARPR